MIHKAIIHIMYNPPVSSTVVTRSQLVPTQLLPFFKHNGIKLYMRPHLTNELSKKNVPFELMIKKQQVRSKYVEL